MPASWQQELVLRQGSTVDDLLEQLDAARHDSTITSCCVAHQDLILQQNHAAIVINALVDLVVTTFSSRPWRRLAFGFAYDIMVDETDNQASSEQQAYYYYRQSNQQLANLVKDVHDQIQTQLALTPHQITQTATSSRVGTHIRGRYVIQFAR